MALPTKTIETITFARITDKKSKVLYSHTDCAPLDGDPARSGKENWQTTRVVSGMVTKFRRLAVTCEKAKIPLKGVVKDASSGGSATSGALELRMSP